MYESTMYDLNFFSLLKEQKEKNKAFRLIGIGALIFIVALNAIMIGAGLFVFSKLETSTRNNQAYLDAPETKAKVRSVAILNQEAKIAEQYLGTIKQVFSSIQKSNVISVELMDHIRNLTPVDTRFVSANYIGNQLTLSCFSTKEADPMDFYHKLLNDTRIAKVNMPGFVLGTDGTVTFSVTLTIKGRD